jgi:hypothetical protein
VTLVGPIARTDPEAAATRPSLVAIDPYARATAIIVYVVLMIVGYDLHVGYGASASLPIAVLLLPLWIRDYRQFSLASALGVLGILSAVSGVWLALGSSVDHAIDHYNRVASINHLLSGIGALALILWARKLMPLNRVVLFYGLGSLASPLLHHTTSWKFDLAVPTTYVVLGVVEHFRSRLVPAITVLALGAIGIIADGRSFFGFCVLAATLTLLQIRPERDAADVKGPRGVKGPKGRLARWFPAIIVLGVIFAVYLISTSLLTGGYLGTTLQDRSQAQVSETGSLLLGGRPEWAATRELMLMRPLGYGAGVVPSWTDLAAGKSGLTKINVDTGGYANNYMFGGQFRLHSVLADLWVSFGLVGLALGLLIIFALLRSLSFLIAERRAATSVIFACSLGIWYMLFGPIFSNWIDVCAALGFALMLKNQTRRSKASISE